VDHARARQRIRLVHKPGSGAAPPNSTAAAASSAAPEKRHEKKVTDPHESSRDGIGDGAGQLVGANCDLELTPLEVQVPLGGHDLLPAPFFFL